MKLMVRIDHVLESWKAMRADVAQAVLDMPQGQMQFRASPDLMTFEELARHILFAGRGLAGMLLNGENDLTAPDAREKMKRYFPALPETLAPADLASELNKAVEADCGALAAQPESFYAGMMKRFDGQPITRLEMLLFTNEHELTHRSQMFTYLRLQGVVPPTTRRKMAKK
ncbi:MAG: DinB family protein [Acidobacteriia bacterium]|nr:DinB family protein [Terriglobia bacterium]